MTFADIPTATRRRLALRAEHAALLLRLVAHALDRARPGAQREAEILVAANEECAEALWRLGRLLAETWHEYPQVALLGLARGGADSPAYQATRIRVVSPDLVLLWAEAWDTWAGQVSL